MLLNHVWLQLNLLEERVTVFNIQNNLLTNKEQTDKTLNI